MSNTTKDKKPLPVAGLFLILYSALFLIHYIDRIDTFDIIKTFEPRFDDIINEISWLIPIFIPLISGIIVLKLKRNHILLPILISFLVWDKLYFFFKDIDHYLCARNLTEIFNSLYYILYIAAILMLLILSILTITSKNKCHPSLNFWFVPGILYAAAAGMYVASIIITGVRTPYFFDDFIFYRCCDIFFKLLFIPVIFLFAYLIYKEYKYLKNKN